MRQGKKAVIAMSGGVDSSVAAYLMVRAGYECIGATMKLYDNEDIGIEAQKTCCSLSDIEDARSVANALGIPYYVFNFTEDFEKEVIERFVNTYLSGGTPNPCIDCNRYLKFEKLMRRMRELDCDYVVTGHYARIEYDEKSGKYLLKKGLDESKDQSYVLYNLTQEQLSHTLLPLGEYRKSEIREIAREQGFINAEKRDSQDICFIPDGNHKKFIERYTGNKAGMGKVLNTDGEVIGRHFGYYRYTVGQGKGVVVSEPGRHYVCEIRPETNEIVVGQCGDLYTTDLIAGDFNWISGQAPDHPVTVQARARYHQKTDEASVNVLEDGTVKVVFTHPQRALTRGQSVVLYDGDVVLGGGIIL